MSMTHPTPELKSTPNDLTRPRSDLWAMSLAVQPEVLRGRERSFPSWPWTIIHSWQSKLKQKNTFASKVHMQILIHHWYFQAPQSSVSGVHGLLPWDESAIFQRWDATRDHNLRHQSGLLRRVMALLGGNVQIGRLQESGKMTCPLSITESTN